MTITSYTREAPSPRYHELLGMYQTVHDEGIPDQTISAREAFSGGSLKRQLPLIRSLMLDTKSRSVLDYGAGKGGCYRARDFTVKGEQVHSVQDYWGVETVACYDPGYAPFSKLPDGQFDAVICTDVLEHLPEQDLHWVLAEQFRYARKLVFANIASYPANKILPNGENAHCTIKPASWWRDLIAAARTSAKSDADYLFVVETKEPRKPILGIRRRPKAKFEPIASRPDWPSKT